VTTLRFTVCTDADRRILRGKHLKEPVVFRRGRRPLAMAQAVALPTGNVEVVDRAQDGSRVALPVQSGPVDDLGLVDGQPVGWSIRSSSGAVLRAGLPTRAAVSRMLGVLATHGEPLPLIVYGPDGRPTGERLG
jgi:hypothetical protein